MKQCLGHSRLLRLALPTKTTRWVETTQTRSWASSRVCPEYWESQLGDRSTWPKQDTALCRGSEHSVYATPRAPQTGHRITGLMLPAGPTYLPFLHADAHLVKCVTVQTMAVLGAEARSIHQISSDDDGDCPDLDSGVLPHSLGMHAEPVRMLNPGSWFP